MIDHSHYDGAFKRDIPAGLYGLTTFSGPIELPKNATPIIARTLVNEGESPDINLTLQHHKSGIVTSENALNIYEGQFPIHLVSYANFINIERELLKKVVDDYDNILDSIVIQDVEGSDHSETTDDGLVF